MCKCPQVLSCVESSKNASACTYGGGSPAPSPSPRPKPTPSPSKSLKVPDSKVYTHFKNKQPATYGLGAWAACGSKFALCSMANCTTNSPALKTSDLGGQLAECGCIPYTDIGVADERISLVDPNYIMSMPLFEQFQNNWCVRFRQRS